MKRTSMIAPILILILFFGLSNSLAQNSKGFLLGLNLATMSGGDIDDYGLTYFIGFSGGLFVVQNFNRNLGFRTELCFSRQGVKWDNENDSIKMQTDYLTVPLLLQYTIQTKGDVKPVFLFGPYAAYLLSAKKVYDFEVIDYDDVDIKKDKKSLDYGLVVGTGVLLHDRFEIIVRYSIGLTSVDDTVEKLDEKNKLLQITAGIRL